MKFIAIAALFAATTSASESNQSKLYDLMALQLSGADCPEPLEISEEELHYQLGEFSRNFGMENWNNA
jgi:hypothetical protein